MSVFLRIGLATALLLSVRSALAHAQKSADHTYRVDCNASAQGSKTILHSVAEVNSLSLNSHDGVLFRRGTTCHGSLKPKGSGFHIGSYGEGPLPIIQADAADEEALLLFNQEEISIDSLEFRGGTTYGIRISGDRGTMHDLSLSNLTISNVRGKLREKESGLVVISPASREAGFENLHLDSIRAFDTTQWAGILVIGSSADHPARFATVDHALVHDVQGDGIAIFNGSQSSIEHSVAWHTGMQHQQTIGTPNAMWTWQCNQCVVEGNEAFLTDSPGVDGGAFDIDWGNTSNRVVRNFAHDTQGYCVSVFAANGPTKDSVISENLCLNNGLSPHLAQRQGAILLMTWNGGTIEGATIDHNRVDWRAAGDTPVVQVGDGLHAEGITLQSNDFHSTGTIFVDSGLSWHGSSNKYFLEHATEADLAQAQRSLDPAHLPDTTIALEPSVNPASASSLNAMGWRLVATMPAGNANKPDYAATWLDLSIAAVEYSHAGLAVSIVSGADSLQAARDWQLPEEGVELKNFAATPPSKYSLALIDPQGRVVQDWSATPAVIDLGLVLRQNLGRPDYGRLQFENVRATN